MKIKSTIHHILKPKKHKWRIFLESIYNKPGDNQKTKALKQTNTNYKAYARYTAVKLPPPGKLHHLSLQETFLHIASTRAFLKNSISIRTLSTLLYYSFGIRNKNEKNPNNLHRFYPSAGAKYPIEAYIIVQSVIGLQKGVYHYYVREHLLERIANELPSNLTDYFMEPFVTKAPVIIALSSIFLRTMNKYGSRGYNYALLEAGHMSQNIYLLSAHLQLSVCGVGGFYEDILGTLLCLDNEIESPIYVLAIG